MAHLSRKEEARFRLIDRVETVFLSASFVTATFLYGLVVGFSLSGRGLAMSLVHPRPESVGTPPGSFGISAGPDRWKTTDLVGLASTVLEFLGVAGCHFVIVSHLSMRRLPGLYALTRGASWLMPFVFVCSSKSRNVDRYGVQSIEWLIFTVMTIGLLIGTLLPVTHQCLMDEEPLPPESEFFCI
uniref:Uncharacterized protein n=1 Tax=Oryza punctata TaxID=4537 RepID=A0A0E0LNK6_ORYPU